jgi:hypothetical protein
MDGEIFAPFIFLRSFVSTMQTSAKEARTDAGS